MRQHGQKNKRSTLGFVFLTFIVLSFAVTPAVAQDRVGDFTKGSVTVGYDNRTCAGTLEGAIRYHSANACVELCDGNAWACAGGCTAPALCPNYGDVCDDGNAGNDPDPLFAGFLVYNDPNSADVGKCKALYVTNDNQSTASQWKTSRGMDDIATDSTEDGKINDSQIPNSTTFPAFKLCKDLTDGGYTDWYLPARDELHVVWKHKNAIDANAAGSFVATGWYRTSVEYDNNATWDQRFNTGHQYFSYLKDDTGTAVRCVRRD